MVCARSCDGKVVSDVVVKALCITVYLQIDFEDFVLNFLKKGYKYDLTNLGFSLPEVSGITWYRWRQGAFTFDPTAKLISCGKA